MVGGGSFVKGAFALGVASGVVLVTKWRPILKESIRTGVRATAVVQEASVKVMENVADVAYEVRAEMGSNGDGGNPPTSSDQMSDSPATKRNGKPITEMSGRRS
jgi:hypothetical protein